MFTLLTTWISQRIITVTAVSVLTVAAVPTTLVIVSHDDSKTPTIAVIQPADKHSKVILVSAVKKAGDDLIAKLNTAESSCTSQVTQTVATSKVAPKLQNQLTNAKSQIRGSVAPIIAAIQSDEDHFAHLTFVTPQDEENELNDLNLIQLITLGNGQSSGTVTITCQTITVTIQESIQITVITQTAPPTCKPSGDED
jgi:hypothetical protein